MLRKLFGKKAPAKDQARVDALNAAADDVISELSGIAQNAIAPLLETLREVEDLRKTLVATHDGPPPYTDEIRQMVSDINDVKKEVQEESDNHCRTIRRMKQWNDVAHKTGNYFNASNSNVFLATLMKGTIDKAGGLNARYRRCLEEMRESQIVDVTLQHPLRAPKSLKPKI